MQVLNQRQSVTPAAGQHGAPTLSMYKDPPTGELPLEDFERFALDRLRGQSCFKPAANKAGIGLVRPYQATCRHRLVSDLLSAAAAPPGISFLRSSQTYARTHAVLKSIEEAKLRNKSDTVVQVGASKLPRAMHAVSEGSLKRQFFVLTMVKLLLVPPVTAPTYQPLISTGCASSHMHEI
jgi:hypothetical protein